LNTFISLPKSYSIALFFLAIPPSSRRERPCFETRDKGDECRNTESTNTLKAAEVYQIVGKTQLTGTP